VTCGHSFSQSYRQNNVDAVGSEPSPSQNPLEGVNEASFGSALVPSQRAAAAAAPSEDNYVIVVGSASADLFFAKEFCFFKQGTESPSGSKTGKKRCALDDSSGPAARGWPSELLAPPRRRLGPSRPATASISRTGACLPQTTQWCLLVISARCWQGTTKLHCGRSVA